MSEKEAVHNILSQALDADESGDIENAVHYYTKAVELILQIKDPTMKEQLNKYAVQALDRAEELRGISSPKHRNALHLINEQEQAQSFHHQQCNCLNCFFFFCKF